MDESRDNREHDVVLNELDDALDEQQYPISNENLITEHSGQELAFQKESITVEEALSGSDPIEGKFRDVDEIHSAFLAIVGSETVGREGYSDRGPESESSNETVTAELV